MKNGLVILAALVSLCSAASLSADTPPPFDAPAAFGARPSLTYLSLSPDGTTVAYVAPSPGQGSVVFTLAVAKGATPRRVIATNGKPDRLRGCDWVSNTRLVCVVYGVLNSGLAEIMPFTRMIAVNADGTNSQLLSVRDNFYTRGFQLGGGNVIDWLPGEDNAVLMTRVYFPDDHLGTLIASSRKGLGVDRIDTRTLATKSIESPRDEAVAYITDGRGTVRIMGLRGRPVGQQSTGLINYLYRAAGSQDWKKLGEYNEADGSGFYPSAVDGDRNVVYGFKKKDGRLAVYSVSLDGSLHEELMFSRPDVDVDELIRVGRRRRVIGVSFATDVRQAVYFDPDIEKLVSAIGKALPGQPMVRIADTTLDDSKLLLFAGKDDDPGVYYLFDRQSRHLDTFLVVRNQLEGVKLATVKAVSYPASDGTPIPGYLTLPPGQESAKGLPAIVMPHGGPASRDEWGFDYLPQFYAAQGFAVLQPNFRGSAGYGDAWLQTDAFRSWRTAIGDVLDAGHWLVAQGIADPAKIGVVGWSYGGYAALQSAVVEPGFFKAVVAIAPVTDLNALKEEHRNWTDYRLVSNYVGDGPQIREGSPAQNADKIKVPVLLFHGAMDRNVGISQSRLMDARLAAAGVRHELVTWSDLDHQLEDSDARTDMLRRSEAFLRQAFGR